MSTSSHEGAPYALVLGATGRIGSVLTAILVERGIAVQALVRDARKARAVLPHSVRFIEGDLRDENSVARAVEACDRIVFVAGANGQDERGSPQEVEFEAVRSLIEATRGRRLERVLLLSSAGVTQPEHPHNCTYSSVLKWKLRGEALVRTSSQPYTIVRALGLREREAAQHGVRLVQGDRIAFGEDIAIGDVAAFLADVIAPTAGNGFEPNFDQGSVLNATFEIYSDTTLPGGRWCSTKAALACDALIT